MADGVKTPTDPSGPTIATDEVTRNAALEHQQVIKLALGAEGQFDTLVDSGAQSAINSVPVALSCDSLRFDEGATYTYIGEAPAGTATAAALWRIKRLTNATNTIVFADGNASFDNVWDDRTGLSYS